MSCIRAVLLFLLLAASGLVHAQTCTVYTRSVSPGIPFGGPYPSHEKACTQACADAVGFPCSGSLTRASCVGTATFITGLPRCSVYFTATNGATCDRNMSVNQVANQACPNCDTGSPGVGETFVVETSVPLESCNPVSGCKMKRGAGVCMGLSCIYSVTHSSETCSSNATQTPNGTAGEKCVEGSQAEFCRAKAPGDKNCGYLNDQFVCIDAVDTDECAVFPDGGRICGASAPTPPVPDNGTAGTPATPTDTMQVTTPAGDTITYNYFNGGTVAGSSRDPGDSGDNPYSDGDDEAEGEGSASGGEGCEAPPSCSGDPVMCAVLQQEWLARCPAVVTNEQVDSQIGENPTIPSSETDMSGAISETVLVGSSGECPAPTTVTLPGGSQIQIEVITWFCSLAERIAPLVMVMAYLVAVMIVARGTEG